MNQKRKSPLSFMTAFRSEMAATWKNSLVSGRMLFTREYWRSLSIYELIIWGLFGLSVFLHFYYLRLHMHFDIDEARHTEIIWGMIKNWDPISKGPPVSDDSGLYHGAFYYYLYAIPVLLSGGNPLASGIFTALLSVFSVYLLAKAVKEQYGELAAVSAAFVYVISYAVNLYGRWIWNPNVIPFFMALSLYALSKFSRGHKRYLSLFMFAVSAITQLHVGGMLFVPVFVCLLPFLIREVKKLRPWLVGFGYALIPWVPTLYHEATHNFEFFQSLVELFSKPSQLPLWDHLEQGYYYLQFMFQAITQLPSAFFLIFGISGFSALVFATYTLRGQARGIFPLYLIFTLLISYAAYSYYPGILYIHVSEHLFVIVPILMSFTLAVLLAHRHTFIAAIVVFAVLTDMNLAKYLDDIVFGDRQYEIVNTICRTIKSNGHNNVVIAVNDKINPVHVTYVCENRHGIVQGNTVLYNVKTDYRYQYDLKEEQL